MATCRQLPYLQPVPSVTKPSIIIMTSFSLWCHSLGSHLRRLQPTTKPAILIMTSFSLWRHSHYDVIGDWAGHTQRKTLTDTLPRLIYKDTIYHGMGHLPSPLAIVWHCLLYSAISVEPFGSFAFSDFTVLVGHQEQHPACKNWVMRCWLSVWSKVKMICICSSWCHCHPSSLDSLKSRMISPAYPGCPGKEAVKWVYLSRGIWYIV